ncbi:MAG: bacillithiol biosynthesis cysteine-adding enzyme BshC [Bacteroidia bacterium]|nr:bacillithiol biosynthesis cysteine-adding enzyme BshC [Bacteroidia bacterium]
MEQFKIDFNASGLFSNLFLDYSDKKTFLENFVVDFPSIENIKRDLGSFKFDYLDRNVLKDELISQNASIKMSGETMNNILLLSKDNSYTVTTGHQLCLFTGPSFFIYKIISCIKTCIELNKEIPGKHFVPVYWMATEDHDLEEIDHAFFYGKKITWKVDGTGRAGEISAKGIEKVLDELRVILGDSENSNKIISLFENSYLKSKNLAGATRFLVNELFGKHGLVILDGNSKALKDLFKEEIKKEIFDPHSFEKVNETSDELEKAGYPVQVVPREINLFYGEKGSRERIIKSGDNFVVVNSDRTFNEAEILKEIDMNSSAFSPNVVLRPLYQQKILPNIIYCGGPGEMAYWLQYKSFFDTTGIHFPFLLPRNFVCLFEKSNLVKWKALGFNEADLFSDEESLIKIYVQKESGVISLEEKKKKVDEFFLELEKETVETDKSLVTFVRAEKQKALNGLDVLEAKLNKFLKQKNENGINQIVSLRAKVFPTGVFQERQENFFAFVNKRGFGLLDEIFDEMESPVGKKEITVFVLS